MKIIQEFWQNTNTAMQDTSNDESQIKQSDTRKSRLTLRQLSKLRRMNDVRAVEYKNKLKEIKNQYAQPAPPPPM
jgi:hypothetical protein